MKNNGIVTLAALCFVALMIWYIIENPNQKKPSEPTLEFRLTKADSTMSTNSTIVFKEYEFSDYISKYMDYTPTYCYDCKIFGPYNDDNEDKFVVEIIGGDETNLKDLESVKLVYVSSPQDSVELSDVLIQVSGKEYEIINGLDILRQKFTTQEILNSIDSLDSTNVHLDD